MSSYHRLQTCSRQQKLARNPKQIVCLLINDLDIWFAKGFFLVRNWDDDPFFRRPVLMTKRLPPECQKRCSRLSGSKRNLGFSLGVIQSVTSFGFCCNEYSSG